MADNKNQGVGSSQQYGNTDSSQSENTGNMGYGSSEDNAETTAM